MKRRKVRTRKPAGRSQPVRLEIEALESRQLLAGFASVAVPGVAPTGEVTFVESAAYINVKIAEPVCDASVSAKSNGFGSSFCNANHDLLATGDLAFSRSVLAVGDGFGLSFRAFEVVTNDSSTGNFSTVGIPFGPQPESDNRFTVIPENAEPVFGPVEQPTQPAPDVGVYYSEPNPATEPQPNDSSPTTSTPATTTSTSQPRIAGLARVQIFSLLSPSDIPEATVPSFDESTVAKPLPNPFEPAITQVDTVFEDLDDELDLPPVGGEFEGFQPTFDVTESDAAASPEFGSTKSVDRESPFFDATANQLSPSALGVLPAVPLNVLENVLDAMVVEESDFEEAPVEQAPVNPDLPTDKAEETGVFEEVADGIHIVESIILLAALPGSLTYRRDDDSEDGFSV